VEVHMRDPRLQIFARNIVNYSVEVQPGENVLIDFIGIKDMELAKCFIEEVQSAGGRAFVEIKDPTVNRALIMKGTQEQFEELANFELARMKQMQCYIAIRGGDNVNELSDVPEEQMKLHTSILRSVTNYRVNYTKWCVMRYPSPSMAQLANCSNEEFEDFYFNVCNLDYNKMGIAMEALVDLMNRTDKVHIIAPGTDLHFSIKDIPARKCDGKRNIPDGEVYTAPVKDSVNGTIAYNAKTNYMGTTFENVCLRFEQGKIVEATSNHTGKLNDVLNYDEGARYIGEFAIGCNPYIHHPMNDILFDEKIDGSIHFTPGQAYEVADNGNRSSVHWDLVLIQRPDYGGGEIYFDDILIRKDGRFVVEALLMLNPENLK